MASTTWQGAENSAPRPASAVNSSLPEHLVLMCASALFSGLSQRECVEIFACARARTFARDELLFSQGQPVRNLILLESGSVKHTQVSENGSEVLLRMSGIGEAVNV
jgi:CRP-like cAMP-binding protein